MKGNRVVSAFMTALFLLLASGAAHALSREEARRAAASAQWAEGALLHDHTLTGHDGRVLRMSDYFSSGKPLIVSFIYTGCGSVCPASTAALLSSVKELRKEYGDGFNVLAIDFNPEETVADIRAFGERYPDGFRHITFATADRSTLEEITKEFGFFYKKAGSGHGYNHLNMVSVVSPGGRIYKQVYGAKIDRDAIGRPLSQLITGDIPKEKPPTLIEGLKMFCSEGDPITGGYSPNYPVIVGLALQGGLILTILYVITVGPLRAHLREHFAHAGIKKHAFHAK